MNRDDRIETRYLENPRDSGIAHHERHARVVARCGGEHMHSGGVEESAAREIDDESLRVDAGDRIAQPRCAGKVQIPGDAYDGRIGEHLDVDVEFPRIRHLKRV